MKFFILLVVLCVAVCTARPQHHSEQYIRNLIRHRRQINLEQNTGDKDGNISGGLGIGDIVYTGDYKHDKDVLFKDDNSKFMAHGLQLGLSPSEINNAHALLEQNQGLPSYEHDLKNNNGGNLNTYAYGQRVESPYGPQSNIGGGLEWQNPNLQGSINLDHQLNGPTSLDAAAGLRYDINDHSDISAQGTYHRTFGYEYPIYGARVSYRYYF